MHTNRGEGEIIGIVILAILGFCIYGVYIFVSQGIGGEQDGTVKYDDCRQVVNLKEGDWATHFKKFTCTIDRATSGKIINGECVHVDLTSDGKCDVAYVYEKTPEISCKGTNQYVTQDGSCSCNYGYVMKGGSCITYDQDCKNSFGSNSYGVSSADDPNTSVCYCNSGYMMNSEKTACVASYF